MSDLQRNELPPPMPKDPGYVPPPRKDRPGVLAPHVIAGVTLHEGQLKEGHVQGLTIRCDEGTYVPGGTDTAPSPLGYFTTAMAIDSGPILRACPAGKTGTWRSKLR